ncbi:MAG: polysialyltransferase family glycosyltransferase [Bacteroidia bacterium]
MKKKKILLNWDYTRNDLLIPFLDMKNDFEFIFIYKYDPEREEIKKFPFQIIFWNDFKDPYSLLRKIEPDKIIFHDIESFHQVALCIAAKNKKITTYVLEHGIKFSLKNVLKGQANHAPGKQKNENVQPDKNTNQFNTLRFYLLSLKLKNILSLPEIISFIYYRKKYGILMGLYKCQFKLRTADHYINFTEFNFRYIKERDKLDPDKLIAIGNPYFDNYFSLLKESEKKPEEPYYLLIDTAFVEDPAIAMEKEPVINYYEKLNAFCLLNSAKLKIKLHPRSYNSNYFPVHTNIEYLKDCNIISEIINARGCFIAHFSTLSPFAMCYSSTVLLNALPFYNTDLTELKIIPEYDFYSFKPEEIKFIEVSREIKEQIIEKYLYKTDGKATERLKQILLT